MIVVSLVACRGGAVFGPTFDSGGAAAEAMQAYVPFGEADLAPRIVVDVAFDATLLVTWFDDDGIRKLTTDAVGDHHEVQVVGLRPGQDYRFEITAFGAAGAAQTHVEHATAEVPFGPVEVVVPGDLNGTDTAIAVSDGEAGGVAVVRGDGEVVWWRATGHPVDDVVADAGGVTALTGGEVLWWAWNGELIARYSVAGEGTAISTPFTGPLGGSLRARSDGWLTLQSVPVTRLDLPLDYAATTFGERTFADPHALHFSRTGSALGSTAATAFWPGARLGWGSLDPGPVGDAWADARISGGDDGPLLWSLPNQDAVVATTGAAVDWVLAQPYGLTPDLEAARLIPSDGGPWHPTSAEWLPTAGDPLLLVFDTGRFGTAPPASPLAGTTSRVVAYALDPAGRRATVAWVLDAPGDTPLSSAHGLAEPQPDGAVLAVWGAVGGPARAHLAVYDPVAGAVVRHQVLSGVEVRGAESLPPVDTFSFIVTADLVEGNTGTSGRRHTGFF